MQSTLSKINKRIKRTEKTFDTITEEISGIKSIFIILLSFMTAGVSFVGTATPFVLALYGVVLHYKIIPFVTLCITILGMAITKAQADLPVYIIACILYSLIHYLLKPKKTGYKAIMMAGTYMLSSVSVTFISGFSFYNFLFGLLFSALTGLLFIIYKKAVSGVEDIGNKIKLAAEQYAALFIVLVVGMSPVIGYNIANINIGVIVYLFVVMICSFYGNTGYASVFVLSIMFIGYISGFTDMFVYIMLGVTVLICALAKGGSKIVPIVGTVIAWLVTSITFSEAVNGEFFIIETLLGIILFASFPMQTGNYVFDIVKTEQQTKNSILFNAGGALMSSKIASMSGMLNKISNLIPNEEFKNTEIKNDAYRLIDIAAGKICENCNKCKYCWEDNFYSTYQAIFAAVAAINTGGTFNENDLPGRFRKECSKIDEFILSINNSCEIFKMDKIYRRHIDNIKTIASNQLSGLAFYINDYFMRMEKAKSQCKNMEKDILNLLISISMEPLDIFISSPCKSKYIVELLYDKKAPYKENLDLILSIVSRVTGQKIEYDTVFFGDNCDIKIICKPVKSYKVMTWIAKKSALDNNVSGDSYTFFENKGGLYIAALGDGMGTGKKAYTRSNTVMSLIECLYDDYTDHTTAINIINSFLAFKTEQESFSTTDLCVLNMYSGEVEFIKAGGCSTFVHNGKDVKLLSSNSAPIGILNKPNTFSVKEQVENTLVSVMLTDGITDTVGEADIRYIISKCEYDDYQHLADEILKTALHKSDNQAKDDMLVMVNKMWTT